MIEVSGGGGQVGRKKRRGGKLYGKEERGRLMGGGVGGGGGGGGEPCLSEVASGWMGEGSEGPIQVGTWDTRRKKCFSAIWWL